MKIVIKSEFLLKKKYGKRGLHTNCTTRSELIINNNVVMHPLYFTGFADSEGCFLILIRKNNNSSIGWNVALKFQISLHIKDIALLEKFRDFLGSVGFIAKESADVVRYRIHSIKDLSVLIYHFDNYPLITQKLADYLIFKQVFLLLKNKDHLTKEGLHKIIALKAVLNLGLSENLKIYFPSIT